MSDVDNRVSQVLQTVRNRLVEKMNLEMTAENLSWDNADLTI